MNPETFDLAFIGHVCYDEIVPYEGESYIAPGSAVLQGALAAARVGSRTAVITRHAGKDTKLVADLLHAGVQVYKTESRESSWMYVGHPSPDVDERRMILKRNAGPFLIDELPDIRADWYHLAGISDREFTLDFMHGLKDRGYHISVDMQSFIRQVDPKTREVNFADVPDKKEIVSLMERVKLDGVEAEILTGCSDPGEASGILLSWGSREVIITRSDGVLANVSGKIFWGKFTHRSSVGRTGRGDTTFAGYLTARKDHPPEWSLKFAASLVSLKMESRGPFQGTYQDVIDRMKKDGRL